MTRKWIVILAVVGICAQCAKEPTALETQKERDSYAIGVELAKSIKQRELDIDMDILIKGLNDESAGKPLLMEEGELRKTLTKVHSEARRKQVLSRRMTGEENKKEGDEFLAENKKKEGVVTLPSGLQYKILKAGEGKQPKETDTVEVHYRGALLNGTEFENSYRTGLPATFEVRGVIPGWREALKLMPVGSKWQIFVPPQLAYGQRGAARHIGPNATLIFELELLAIK
jgi:FKBP-type peptidyl-prolyl cis-trans isomerase FklB